MNACRPWSRLAALVCVLALLPAVVAAAAQPAGSEKPASVKLPEPLTREAIRELVARLSDAEVRELLLAQLDKAAAPEADQGGGHPTSRGTSTAPGASWGRCSGPHPMCPRRWVRRWPGSPRDAPRTTCCSSSSSSSSCWRSAGSRSAWWDGCSVASVAGSNASPGDGPGVDPGSLVIGLVLDLLLLAVFVATVFAGFLALYQGHEPSRALIMSALVATVQVRLAMLVARFLLAPHTPAQRLLPFDDAAAGVLYRGLVTLAWLYGLLDRPLLLPPALRRAA